MSAVTNAQLAEQLGDVREKLGAIAADQQHAATGRSVLHEKLDRLTDSLQLVAISLAETGKDATLATTTAAQTRDRMDALDRSVTADLDALRSSVGKLEKTNADDIEPVIKVIGQVRAIAIVLVAISGLGIASVGSVFTFFNSTARHIVLDWLDG